MKKFLIAGIILVAVSSVNADNEMKNQDSEKLEKATVAGGCFWCLEPPFDKLKGVISTTPGYTGGHIKNPAYAEVSEGTTGHAEAVEIVYDPAQISYAEILDVFWRQIDPTTLNRQFADEGTQYRTVIFYHNEEQKRIAEESKEKLGKSGRFAQPIVTEIAPAQEFYPAEDYHQDYYKKNATHYNNYSVGSGRKGYIQKTWGDKKDKE